MLLMERQFHGGDGTWRRREPSFVASSLARNVISSGKVGIVPLRLLASSNVRRSSRDFAFHPRRIHAVGGFLFFLTLAGGALGWAWLAPALGRESEIPRWLTTFVGVTLLIFVWFGWRSLRGSLRSESWLVLSAFDGLYVRFRSHLNFDLPQEDPTIVFIPNEDVASVRARRVKMKRTAEVEGESAPLGGEKYVEIRVEGESDLVELEEALTAERKKRGDGKGGGGTVSLHYPVRVLPGGVIEFDWSGIQPGLRRAVKLLGRTYSVAPEEVSRAPMLEDLPPEEREDQLRALMSRGETILAIKLTRKFYGYNLAEAKSFLDGLVG